MKKFISIFTSIMIILCFSTSAFALDKAKEADILYNKALNLKNSNPEESIRLLTEAISYNPQNPEYYFQRGFIEPDYKKAILDYERAVVLDPDKYYNKCFGFGIKGNKIITRFNTMIFNTNWKIDNIPNHTLDEIKSYLATYTGDKLQNAQSIIDKATGEQLIMVNTISPNEDALGSVAITIDYTDRIPNPQTYIAMIYQIISNDSEVSDIGSVTVKEIGDTTLSYLDYSILVNNETRFFARVAAVDFDYYTVEIKVFALNKDSLNYAIEDFVNTIEVKTR